MPTKAELEERVAELEDLVGEVKESPPQEVRSYTSKADYPCTGCGCKSMPEVASANPDTQVAFKCAECGLYHEVHKSRFQ